MVKNVGKLMPEIEGEIWKKKVFLAKDSYTNIFFYSRVWLFYFYLQTLSKNLHKLYFLKKSRNLRNWFDLSFLTLCHIKSHLNRPSSPNSDAQFELQKTTLIISTCINALSFCHCCQMIDQISMLTNS